MEGTYPMSQSSVVAEAGFEHTTRLATKLPLLPPGLAPGTVTYPQPSAPASVPDSLSPVVLQSLSLAPEASLPSAPAPHS